MKKERKKLTNTSHETSKKVIKSTQSDCPDRGLVERPRGLTASALLLWCFPRLALSSPILNTPLKRGITEHYSEEVKLSDFQLTLSSAINSCTMKYNSV